MKKFKREDLVEVSNNGEHWLPAKYLTESFSKNYPHCVAVETTHRALDRADFKFCRKRQNIYFTHEEASKLLEKQLGKPVIISGDYKFK